MICSFFPSAAVRTIDTSVIAPSQHWLHPLSLAKIMCVELRFSGGVNLMAPIQAFQSSKLNHLVGLVVKASTSRAEDSGLASCLRQDFSGQSHTNDLKIGTPVATLPDSRRYRVSGGTGWRGVSIL